MTVKQKQYALMGGVVVLGAMVILGILLSVEDVEPRQKPEPVEETKITTVGQRVSPQEVWVEQIQTENKLTNQKIEQLEKLLKANVKESTKSDQRFDEMMKELDEARKKPVVIEPAVHHEPSIQQVKGMPPQPMNMFPPMSQVHPHNQPAMMAPTGVRKIVLNLSKRASALKAKTKSTIENTIPAGSFAKAVLLGGVDASTSITAQNDPRPVLLRVTDHGSLPRCFKSDLKDCHVLASSYGDLSSERVYMRLEKLTCTERLTGEISETQVSGYVVGEDGRAGIRGVVADRAGPMLRNSLVGGFFSGISQFVGAQQQSSVFPVSPFGQTDALNPKQMLTAGAANGTSAALDKYADFFIKRAEQLQPVLQVAAGRAVNIVFTQGTEFGETSVKKTLSKIREHSRKEAVNTLEDQADNKSWLPNQGDAL